MLIRVCYLLILFSACGPKAGQRMYPAQKASEILQELVRRQSAANSFLAESKMEYWVDGERIKPTVQVMGERGAKIRFNALNPTGGDVAADLACGGTNFHFVDFNNNCQMQGVCDQNAILKLLRVRLSPDDFLLLATGGVPLIATRTSTVRWNSETQQEILTLHAADNQWKQQIILDGRGKTWDVLASTVWNAAGEVEWKLTNREFSSVKSDDGVIFRVPNRTKFEQPMAKAELSIRWLERILNPKIAIEKFAMEEEEYDGLPICGQSHP